MFRGLRNRFLILHMGIVVLLVLVFFGAILFINYQYISRSLDAILNRAFSATIRLRQDISYPNEERRVYRNVQPLPRDKAENHFLPIFTVQLDENKNIKRVISAFPLEEAFYSKVTSLALGNSEDGGTIMHDGLLLKYRADKDRIVFLDITKERDMFLNTVHTFLWIAVPLLLVIYLISRYFANRSIKPIEESYNKQREFIADASHELRTPIAAISTNLDILMDLSDENQKKWLSYIKQETERMASLTTSLLYLARLDFQKDGSNFERFNLSRDLENYLIALEAVFFERKIKTEINILPNIFILGDKEQIIRLVATLVENAIKYTDGFVKISLERSGNSAKLIVYNTGKGISSEDLPKIWDRFYRGDKSRGKTGGFGLGLSIAKAIAQKHGGSIWAESVENEWIKFIFKIPLTN